MVKVIENYGFENNTYLMKLILGRLEPERRDKFYYISGTTNGDGTNGDGVVSYRGTKYAWCIMDGKIKVMREAEAGWNWSETLYSDKGNWVNIDTIS